MVESVRHLTDPGGVRRGASVEHPTTQHDERRSGAGSRRVLVVDDNRDAADALADLAGLWGYEATAVYDGPAALRAAREQPPAIVLLDIGMPDMDGYEVARRLRGDPATAAVVLVALTGYGQAADRDRAFATGFRYHLVKPVSAEALEQILACAG